MIEIFYSSKFKKKMSKHTISYTVKTVIVGAGISGIGAACNLLKNGYQDFIILEANDRIGGRIETIEHGKPLYNMYISYNKIEAIFK